MAATVFIFVTGQKNIIFITSFSNYRLQVHPHPASLLIIVLGMCFFPLVGDGVNQTFILEEYKSPQILPLKNQLIELELTYNTFI